MPKADFIFMKLVPLASNKRSCKRQRLRCSHSDEFCPFARYIREYPTDFVIFIVYQV